MKNRLEYFAKMLRDHEEYVDSYTMGHLERALAQVKQETIREIGETLLEILEVDEKTFKKNWLPYEDEEEDK